VDAHAHRAAVLLRDGEQLDDAADRLGARDVGRRHLGDALAVHVGGDHAGVEGEPARIAALGRGVEALDVGGGVGLGVAQRRGLVERVGEARALLVHRVRMKLVCR
jgi:hypothetical protein